ncbi:MAG: DEAD/DEAH box helicase [Acidimicrobiia bacterium]
MTHALADAPTFASLGVAAPVVRALAALGIETAFPIQVETLAIAQSGRDLIAKGPTGSGKTVAFALPTIARLAEDRRPASPRRPRALVLVPTRELAEQVAATFDVVARPVGLSVATVYGGVSQRPQVRALTQGVDIVVACPGRLEDLIAQRACSLDAVEITVLDEADHLADLGFLPAVRRLLDRTPADGQRLLFSATIDKALDTVVRRYLHDPVTRSVATDPARVTDMEHHVLHVAAGDKQAVVRTLAATNSRTLLFTRTKRGARKLAGQLTASGVPAVELHGNLSQNARTRNLEAFASGEVTALVATDIAARGIHVDDIGLVVHVDPPAEHKAYLHRSGRTARAGARGTVVTVATPDQRKEVAALARAAGVTQRSAEVTPQDPLLRALVEGTALPVIASAAPAQVAAPQGSDARRARSGAPAGRGDAPPRRSDAPARRGDGPARRDRPGPTGDGRSAGGTSAGEQRSGDRRPAPADAARAGGRPRRRGRRRSGQPVHS